MTLSKERFRQMQHSDSAYYDSTPEEKIDFWKMASGQTVTALHPFEDGYMHVTLKARFKVETVKELQEATQTIEDATEVLNGSGECLNSTLTIPKLELKS